nr:hypothetical protein [Tanacetum cinerariifolium]
MVNVIPPDHVDEVPIVEPNQHIDNPVVPVPVLMDEDENPEEDKFKEEEGPQEEEYMEINVKEDKNEPEMTYPYEEVDPFNPSPPASESEPDDEIKVENLIEHEDETVPASVHEMAFISRRLCSHEMAHVLVEKKGKEKDKFYGKLILELGNEVRSSVEQGTFAMEKLVEKLGNTEDKVECKKLKRNFKKQGDLCLKKDRMKQSMFRLKMRRVMHLSRDDILLIGNSLDSIVFAPMTQVAIRRMIKDRFDAAIATEWARQTNELEEARFSNTFLRMQNDRVERDLYWTRVQAHEFYQEMIRRGFVFEERPNDAINVSIEDEKSPSSEPQGSPHDA